MENTFGMDIIPENDQQRIEALKRYKIPDILPEPAFDNVTKLAAQFFSVPVSRVSLVDAEQVFFKTGKGDPASVSRGLSLCSLAILNHEVTVFEDTRTNPLLLNNPLIRDNPGIGFYAGAPLLTPDGFAIGTLCITDQHSRSFSPHDAALLKSLAEIVMDEIELRLAAIEEPEKQREEELQLLNEKLTTTVEELAAANEVMLTTNEELAKTHDNLHHTMNRLTQSESRFRELIEQAPVAVLVLRGDGMVLEIVNPYMLKLLGHEPDIVGQPLLRGMPEMAGQPVFDIIYEVYRTGKPYYGFESPMIMKREGKTKTGYFNYAYTPLLENGKIRGVLQVATEVTEQVLIREELQKAEEMLRFSIEAANVGTWFIDIQTLEFMPSSSMKKLFGYLPDDEMSYDAILGQVSEDYRKKIIIAINATFTRSESFNIEFSIITKQNQKLRWIRAIGKLDNDADGKLIHFSGVAIDITEQKQDEIRKNDFIAMVSHELKTPLTSLKGYMQLLTAKNRKNEDGFTFQALEKGNAQITKMTNMINGFLNVSQLEAGKIYLNKQVLPLNDLMDEIVEEISITTQNHYIIIRPCPIISVNADQEKIGQVINNFLSNAVKYSPRGKNIELSCKEVNGWVQVSVKDEGIGINAADIDKLFDRFYRVDNPNTQNISGFGIGLYLCSEIIQRHNGKIWVESEPGKGSVFHFSLPMI